MLPDMERELFLQMQISLVNVNVLYKRVVTSVWFSELLSCHFKRKRELKTSLKPKTYFGVAHSAPIQCFTF